jgi:hypothetical protein
MKNTSLLRSAALLAALALAVPAFSKPISKTIEISRAAKFGKTEVDAGEYRLLIDGNKVVVKKGSRVLAETEGRWEESAEKSRQDSVEIAGNGQVKRITFEGKTRVLILSE